MKMRSLSMRIKKDFISKDSSDLNVYYFMIDISIYCYYFEESPKQALHFIKENVNRLYNKYKKTDDVNSKYPISVLKGFTLVSGTPEELSFYIEKFLGDLFGIHIVSVIADTHLDAYKMREKLVGMIL